LADDVLQKVPTQLKTQHATEHGNIKDHGATKDGDFDPLGIDGS
jgi:hypothetical protein